MSKAPDTIPIKVLLYGGLDLLFAGAHTLDIHLPVSPSSPPTASSLIAHLTDAYLADARRRDLFTRDGSVTPGILVLINEADWELEGLGAAVLGAGDEVVFVSTLHGG